MRILPIIFDIHDVTLYFPSLEKSEMCVRVPFPSLAMPVMICRCVLRMHVTEHIGPPTIHRRKR